MYSYIFLTGIASLAILSAQGPLEAEHEKGLPVYIYTDFGGGSSTDQRQAVSDWQTAIELAGAAWKTTERESLFINDSAKALSPSQAANQLAAAFPYQPTTDTPALHKIVVHVIDPGVGNESYNPRALVWRKDGVIFVGPDNGSLTLACPPGSIAGAWEIDADKMNALTGSDTSVGGTFHGRDLFSLAAYLIADDHAFIEDIATRYETPELRFRFANIQKEAALPPKFVSIATNRWKLASSNFATDAEIFSGAYFLTIVQWPIYSEILPAKSAPKQLFFVDSCQQAIAIVNRRTGNIFIGPDNGVGTAFFAGFDSKDVWITSLNPRLYEEIANIKSNEQIYQRLLQLPPYDKKPVALNLEAQVSHDHAHCKVLEARIWLDAYGNIKTTLTNEQLQSLYNAGFHQVSATLNGVTILLISNASSFAEVPPGQAFIYVGSSGAVGKNPHRSRRYVEVSSNGVTGQFGVDLFSHVERPYTGQSITFQFNIK